MAPTARQTLHEVTTTEECFRKRPKPPLKAKIPMRLTTWSASLINTNQRTMIDTSSRSLKSQKWHKRCHLWSKGLFKKSMATSSWASTTMCKCVVRPELNKTQICTVAPWSLTQWCLAKTLESGESMQECCALILDLKKKHDRCTLTQTENCNTSIQAMHWIRIRAVCRQSLLVNQWMVAHQPVVLREVFIMELILMGTTNSTQTSSSMCLHRDQRKTRISTRTDHTTLV